MKKLYVVEFNLSELQHDEFAANVDKTLAIIPTFEVGKTTTLEVWLGNLEETSSGTAIYSDEEWLILLGEQSLESDFELMEIIATLNKTASKLHLVNLTSTDTQYTLLSDKTVGQSAELDKLLSDYLDIDSVDMLTYILFNQGGLSESSANGLEKLIKYSEERLVQFGYGKHTHTAQADPNEDMSKLIKAVTGELVKLNRNLNPDETNESRRVRERNRRPSVRQAFGGCNRDECEDDIGVAFEIPKWGRGDREVMSMQRARLDIEDAINHLTVGSEYTVEGLFTRIQKDLVNLSLLSAALFNKNKLDSRDIDTLHHTLGGIDDSIMRATIDLLETARTGSGRMHSGRY